MAYHRSVLLLGATGLVGGECLRLLQANEAFGRIVCLTRRPLDEALIGPKVEAHVINFEHLTSASRFFAVDQIICALGTTMKDAGSRRNFRTVDLLHPLTAAHLGVEKKVSHFLVVTSLGADPRSPIYSNRVKGELEKALSSLSFRSLTIARPSILLGARARPRAGERIAGLLSFITPARVRAIAAADVAAALVYKAAVDAPGKCVLDSAELRRIAAEARTAHAQCNVPVKMPSEVSQTSVA